MNARKLAYLMGTTFLWSGSVGLVTGFLLALADPLASDWQTSDWMVGMIGWVWGGLIYGALSLLGFFAFLIMNQLGLGLFKGPRLWAVFMGIVILVTYFDMVYFRYQYFGKEDESLLDYVALPTLLLAWGLIVAYWKMKATHRTAFVPTLFFMFAITVLELIPALRTDNLKSILDMLFPLLAANTWQVLILHKLLPAKKS